MKKYMIATLFISGLLVGSASAFRRAAVTAQTSINVHSIRNQAEAHDMIRKLEKQKRGMSQARKEQIQMDINRIKSHFNIQ